MSNQMNQDGARKLGQQWAQQGKQFDPKQFQSDALRKEAEAAFKRQQEQSKKK